MKDYAGGEVFAVNKPKGWTSFDVVKRIRGEVSREAGKKIKVGHAGTLDPLATGVLVLCTGKATRKIGTIQASEKEYEAVIRLGETTPSYDLETEVDRWYGTEGIEESDVRRVLGQFVGKIQQIPPMYSACKVRGVRSYELARNGVGVPPAAREVEIKAIEVLWWEKPEMCIRVVCGKGTYIRSLARDIGEALGNGGVLTELVRTRVGKWRLGENCGEVE
jgi:tRNA pseudouridine55 synthase